MNYVINKKKILQICLYISLGYIFRILIMMVFRDLDEQCGVLCCRFSVLQCCVRIGVFVVFYCLVFLCIFVILVYMFLQIIMLEKQFGFISVQSGFLMSCNDIGFLLIIIFVVNFVCIFYILCFLFVFIFCFGLFGVFCFLVYFLLFVVNMD